MKSSGEEWNVRAHVDCVCFLTARKGILSSSLLSSATILGSMFEGLFVVVERWVARL